jgi:hypothetical protein
LLLASRQATSLDEERDEVVASVLQALAEGPADSDRLAACSLLLKHLADTTGGRCPVAA